MNGTPVGSYSVSCSVSFDTDSILSMAKANISEALTAMATATVQRAKMLAPMSNLETRGDLRNSGRVDEVSQLEKAAVFGNEIVPYARYQEFGGDGKRVVRNYTTPGTQAHYLKEAGDSVAREGIKKYL